MNDIRTAGGGGRGGGGQGGIIVLSTPSFNHSVVFFLLSIERSKAMRLMTFRFCMDV